MNNSADDSYISRTHIQHVIFLFLSPRAYAQYFIVLRVGEKKVQKKNTKT